MKRKLIAGAGAALLISALVISQALAAGGTETDASAAQAVEAQESAAQGTETSGTETQSAEASGTQDQSAAQEAADGFMGGRRPEMTDEQIAEMEAARTEREEKLNGFIASLSDEQKAVYDELFGDIGQDVPGFMGGARGGMGGGMGGGGHGGMGGMGGFFGDPGQELTDEQIAEMEAAKAAREEKTDAFVASLSDDQKALYDAMTPAAPEKEGQRPQKPDEATMTAMREARDALVASLTDEQKTAYDELFAERGWKRAPQPAESASSQQADVA